MANTRPDQDQLHVENSDKYLESTGDSGFFSNTNSTTYSCSSEIYFSESNISGKNDFGLSDEMTQLSLNCTDCLNANSDFTEEKAYQELWELCFAQDESTGDTLLHAAIIQNCLEATLKIISVAPHPCLFDILNDYTQTALHLAVMTDQPKVVRSLVLAGADPSIKNSEGNTALHLASISGNLECAKALTESMATCRGSSRSLNLPNELQILEQRNYNGETCLHLAACKDNIEIVKLLINLGADLEAQEYLGGRRVLHLALEYGSLKTVLFLIQECQPNLDVKSFSGYTPLQIANFIDEKIAYELIKLGATPQSDSEDEGFYTGELKETSEFIKPSVTYRSSVVSL